jgi:hypothetical protein
MYMSDNDFSDIFERWAGHVACMREERKVYIVLVGKPKGRPRHRWENEIRMDLREIGWRGVDWI